MSKKQSVEIANNYIEIHVKHNTKTVCSFLHKTCYRTDIQVFFNILTMDYLGTYFSRDFNLTFKTRILVDYSKLKAFLKQALVVKRSILI